ncbi:hypothetical protein T484DRAFT_1862146 [Baffinella frigidus]|nr:hypothetical protein T484DRAFT_1862146 [Cryptophyta sp. CCMP2293]
MVPLEAATLDFALSDEAASLQQRLLNRVQEKKGSSWLIDWWNQEQRLLNQVQEKKGSSTGGIMCPFPFLKHTADFEGIS